MKRPLSVNRKTDQCSKSLTFLKDIEDGGSPPCQVTTPFEGVSSRRLAGKCKSRKEQRQRNNVREWEPHARAAQMGGDGNVRDKAD